jgi:hypothetical protein
MSTPAVLPKSTLSIPLAVLMVAIAVTGFWRTYFRDLLLGAFEGRWLLHLHAALAMGWLFLVGAQAYLAATGRRALHVRVGRWGMAYGVVLIGVSLGLALTNFADGLARFGLARVERSMVAPFCDMFVFALFLASAWLTRRRPEAHKRFILLATNALLIAAVGRLFGGTSSIAFDDVLPFLIVWLSPLLIAIAYDAHRYRRIHFVYLFGLVVLTALRYRQLLRESDFWPVVTHWLADRLT